MRTDDVSPSLITLFDELVSGAPDGGAYVLNGGDPGLLRVLARLSAEEASAARDGGATIAAHTAHVAYGLSLLNRWADGENPYPGADWSAAWRIGTVGDDAWAAIRDELREQAERWNRALRTPREVDERELNGMIGAVAHVAYHLGAIRQIAASTRGPRDAAPDGSNPRA
jgi:hypothetical protein